MILDQHERPMFTSPSPWLSRALMKDMVAVFRLTASLYRPVDRSKFVSRFCTQNTKGFMLSSSVQCLPYFEEPRFHLNQTFTLKGTQVTSCWCVCFVGWKSVSRKQELTSLMFSIQTEAAFIQLHWNIVEMLLKLYWKSPETFLKCSWNIAKVLLKIDWNVANLFLIKMQTSSWKEAELFLRYC